jgi:single-strand DNA-binding protein
MFHKVILVGNLGKDPEMRYTPGGQPVTSFSVASNRKYTDSGGQQVEETIWFRISVWGKPAEGGEPGPAAAPGTEEEIPF